MRALNIRDYMRSSTMVTKMVTGFDEGELEELKAVPHEEAREKLMKMLDERNGNIGTCWEHGYGVYGIWFDNEAAYVNIGASCD